MKEKKSYVAPTIESIDMSATQSGIEPCGPVPPTDCGAIAATADPIPSGPMS